MSDVCPVDIDFQFQSQSGARGVNTSHSHLKHIMSSDFKIFCDYWLKYEIRNYKSLTL